MLRTFQGMLNKPANTMYKAAVAMKTGMAVVMDDTNKTVGFPGDEIGVNLSFIDKERIPTGINTARGDMSDYDPNFIDVAADEMVKLINFVSATDKFGTDQYVATGLTVGDMLSAGIDGKLKKATAALPSIYKYVGTYDDNGHTLAMVQVLPVAETN